MGFDDTYRNLMVNIITTSEAAKNCVLNKYLDNTIMQEFTITNRVSFKTRERFQSRNFDQTPIHCACQSHIDWHALLKTNRMLRIFRPVISMFYSRH